MLVTLLAPVTQTASPSGKLLAFGHY